MMIYMEGTICDKTNIFSKITFLSLESWKNRIKWLDRKELNFWKKKKNLGWIKKFGSVMFNFFQYNKKKKKFKQFKFKIKFLPHKMPW